jgi:hypothetical protein
MRYLVTNNTPSNNNTLGGKNILFKNTNKTISDDSIHNYYSGNDERYPLKYNETKKIKNEETLYKIRKNIFKLHLLQYLNDETNSQYDKLSMIHNYNQYYEDSQYKPNINNGGLYNDW